MVRFSIKKIQKILPTLLLTGGLSFGIADACTRIVFHGDNERIMTARSMDWKVDVGTNLWILPRGIDRTGAANSKSIHWKAKYGSVIASGYDIATTDGMNEAGLAANLLWLAESEYPDPHDVDKPTLSLSLWAQYMLDNFATVQEAVNALEAEPFIVISDQVPGDTRLAALHLSLSDKYGDSAIVEYIDGKQVIHHNKAYQVMTNSPAYEKQLALNDYWKQIGGTVMLPGSNRAADRFVRASFYINSIPKDGDERSSLASVFSVIRNVSVPFGLNTEAEPNISSTRWRTVIDHKARRYFFESAVSPNLFWVDLNKVDFSGAEENVKKLDLGPDQSHIFGGEVSGKFEYHPPFQFLPVSHLED